jgi:hypothetical protein
MLSHGNKKGVIPYSKLTGGKNISLMEMPFFSNGKNFVNIPAMFRHYRLRILSI